VRISICGRLRVETDAGALEEESLPGRLGRRLWVYLVLNRRRPIGRGEIGEALWGEDTPEAADASLNALVSRLRSAIRTVAPDVKLRASGGTYSLALPADVFVDRERAWTAIHHVEALRRQGDSVNAWAEAGAWIEAERRTLRDTELQALEAIGQAEIDRHRADEAERVGRRLIAADPLRESGYRLLMRALAAGGNPAQAGRVMDECRSALAAAAASPSAETERLYREIVGRSSRLSSSAG